jgi:choline monooxygenase
VPWSLPASLYTDPAAFEREQALIFANTWQWIGRSEQVRTPTSFLTGSIAREPVVVSRDRAGTLHAFSGSCRHRGGPVAGGAGDAAALRCRYHGWTYRLDGTLAHAPGVPDATGCDLPRFHVAEWHGHVFVFLGSNPTSLAEVMAPLDRWAANYALDELHFDHRDTYELDCNWKTYIDNSQEGYHIPFVHPMLNTALDLHSYRQECDGLATRQIAPFSTDSSGRGGADDLDLFRLISPIRDGLVADETQSSMFINVFPNFVVNLHPDHVVTEVIEPVDAEHARIHLDYWFDGTPSGRLGRIVRRIVDTGVTDAPSTPGGRFDQIARRLTDWATATPPRHGAQRWFQRDLGPELARALNIYYTDQAQHQDNEITATTQRGIRAPSFDGGPLSPTRENTVAHFHELVRRFLA